MTLTLYSVIHSPVELCELRPAGGPTHVVIANRAGFDIDGFFNYKKNFAKSNQMANMYASIKMVM